MMRRSWREGQDEIRQDLEWERERAGELDFGGERSVTSLGRDRNIIQTLILVYI